MEAAISASVN
jgi:hypothetical protein